MPHCWKSHALAQIKPFWFCIHHRLAISWRCMTNTGISKWFEINLRTYYTNIIKTIQKRETRKIPQKAVSQLSESCHTSYICFRTKYVTNSFEHFTDLFEEKRIIILLYSASFLQCKRYFTFIWTLEIAVTLFINLILNVILISEKYVITKKIVIE